MMRRLTGICLALLLTSGAAPGAYAADAPPRTISVMAEGAVAAKPDMARVSVGVVTRARHRG